MVRATYCFCAIVSELFEHALIGSFGDFFVVLFVLGQAAHSLDN
jgi:hypothetical protein